MKKTVDVVIPSYKPDHKFDRLMHMLQKQTYPIGTILIVNTEEKFFPEKGYETWQNVQIRHIETEDFDHGGTRDGAASLLDGDLLLKRKRWRQPMQDSCRTKTAISSNVIREVLIIRKRAA